MALYDLFFGSDSSSDEENFPQFSIDNYSDLQIYQRTRVSRPLFHYLVEILTPIMNAPGRGRRAPLSIEQQIYIALNFYASGGYQWLVGSGTNKSQSAASRCISNVTSALVKIAPNYIKFPINEEYHTVKQNFYQLGANSRFQAGMPNVIGAIDCVHVEILSPANNPDQYVNRHFTHSINTQIICGPDLKCYNVLAAFPGGNYDSYIWRNSSFRTMLEEGNFTEGWLVGDSGYPLEPWLLTPITRPGSPGEHLYNATHIQTRNVIERFNGVLKSRWRCLSKCLRYTPDKVCQIIVACCVLHNICLEHNMPPIEEECANIPGVPPGREIAPMVGGQTIRDNLVKTHFTR